MFCWRLRPRGSLIQDTPILPGMLVYYVYDERIIESRVVGIVSEQGSLDSKHYWAACCEPKPITRQAARTFVTREAALEAIKLAPTQSELASYWARVHNVAPKESLWTKVTRTGSTDCWPWAGAVDDKGFGQVQFGPWLYPAHGVAYDLYCRGGTDAVVPGCGNKLCCNPKHMIRRELA